MHMFLYMIEETLQIQLNKGTWDGHTHLHYLDGPITGFIRVTKRYVMMKEECQSDAYSFGDAKFSLLALK